MSEHSPSQARDSRNDDTREADHSIHDLQGEREVDRVVQLLGERALRRLDPTSAHAPHFFDWWARELREQTPRAELEAGATAFARRVRRRIAEAESRVRLMHRPASFRVPPFEAAVSSMVDVAPGEGCVALLGQSAAAGAGRELWDEPCTSWLEVPEGIPPGRHVAMHVTGDSMEPLLHAGDTILVKIDPELRRGAVIVARRPDEGYVVKRVSRVGAKVVELTSLHAGYPPIRIPRRDDLILGTVLMCWRRESRTVTR